MLDVLYEDNHIIVAYKEKGILSQPDGSNRPDMLTILKKYIKEKYNKPGEVYLGLLHRLDTNTSGVMVFARTSKAAKRLSEDIKNHNFEKHYKATVEGIIKNDSYVRLENKISKNENEKKAYIDNKNGKEAILDYKLIRNYQINGVDVSDIEVNLLTGRFHQIRLQMSNIGHPLYGDIKYGSKHKLDDFNLPLDAYYLKITHPVKHEVMEFKR